MDKADVNLSSQEKIARLVEYARGSKTPSVWWNGIEYKWDKKHGKYLHWVTLPSGERKADEPPYEATNPLFAAVGIEAEDNEPKKETTAPKEEKKNPKPEPVVKPKEEPTTTPPATDETPTTDAETPTGGSDDEGQDKSWLTERGDYRGLYRSLMEKAADFDTLSKFFQDQYREELSYALNNEFVPTHHFNLSDDDINDILKAKNIVNDSSVLPDVRRIVLRGAVSKLDYGNSNPFPLALDLANGNLPFPAALEAVENYTKWLNASDYAIDATWKNVASRADALKVVSKIPAVRFVSAQDNTEIEDKTASLLKLAESPAISNVEALYIASKLKSLEDNIKSGNYEYSTTYQGARKGQKDEEKKQWFISHKREVIFDELNRIEKDVAVLRNRPQNDPQTSPIEETPKPEEKPLPPMTANHPIGSEKKETPKEPEKKESDGVSYQQIAEIATSSDMSFREKNEQVKAWAESFFPDDERFSAVKDFLTSDKTPFYAKKSMLGEISKTTEYKRARQFAETTDGKDSVPEFKGFQEFLDFCSQTSIKSQSEMTRALSEYVSNIQTKLKSDWKTIQTEDFFTSERPYWDGLQPFSRNLRWGKDAERFGDRDSAIKNFRSLIKIPSSLSKEEKQSVLDRIAYVGSLAKLPTTTDEEACMLMSEMQSIGQGTVKNARFAVNFDAQFQRSSFQEKIDEIASRSDEAPEKPKELVVADKDDSSNSGETSSGYASSANAYKAIVESVRNEMTPEEAERDRNETEKLDAICNQVENESWLTEHNEIYRLKKDYETSITDRARELESMKALIAEKYPKSWYLGFGYIKDMLKELDGPESSRVPESEKGVVHSLLEEYKGKEARFNAALDRLYERSQDERKTLRTRESVPYDHEKTLKFLKKAFPDRGGAAFFPPEWREEALKVFAERNPNVVKVANEVFDVYDIIGRCFNTGGREFDMPNINFGHTSNSSYGECAGSRHITLNWSLRNPEEVRATLAHELGHWLENAVCGLHRINDNAGWLKEKLGHLQLTSKDQWSWQKSKTPGLTVDPTGYSFRVYKFPGGGFIGRTKDFFGCSSTELISSGMEFLTAFPTIYTVRAPEHFNLLVKNFEVISQHDKKDE